MQSMATNTGSPFEDIAFCEEVVAQIPASSGLWEQHLENESGEALPYVFLNDVAAWAEDNAMTEATSIKRLVEVLNDAFENGPGDVPNLVLAGFMEGMSVGTDLVPHVNGTLKAWLEYEFGIADTHPTLRRGEE